MTVISDGYRKLFEYALKIYLVIGTLFYLPTPAGFNTHMQILEWGYLSQELFFRYGAVFIFCCSLMIKPLRRMNTKALPLLLIYLMLSSALISYGVAARRTLLNMFIGIMFYKVIVEYFDFRQIKSFMLWLFWLLMANLVLCQLQLMRLDPIFSRLDAPMGIVEPVGFMRLLASLGVLSAIVGPAVMIINPWAAVVAVPLIYYSKASAAVLGFMIGIGTILFFRLPRKIFIGALMALFLAGAGYVAIKDMPNKTSSYSRFEVWGIATSHTLKVSPFFGIGAGSFRGFEPRTEQKTSNEKLRWIWVHNEYIQVLFEFGIVGLVIVLVFLKNRVKEFFDFKADRVLQCLFGSFLAIMTVSFFHFPWHLGKMVGICIFMVALYHARITELRSLYED